MYKENTVFIRSLHDPAHVTPAIRAHIAQKTDPASEHLRRKDAAPRYKNVRLEALRLCAVLSDENRISEMRFSLSDQPKMHPAF